MALDMYAPCPCGSGKKLRFCCQAISEEMIRAERLIANEQPRPALQILEKLGKSNPANSWVATRRAVCLLNDLRAEEARLVLLAFLKQHPDHPEANALHAFCQLHTSGYQTAKKAVHRAFRRSIGAVPDMVSELALAAADWHEDEDRPMASRQYLSMAVSLCGKGERRDELMNRLREMNMDETVPTELRGMHPLPEYQPSPAAAELAERAIRLAGVGCWDDAADLFVQVVAVDGERPEPWIILGTYRAWDGNHAGAAEAYRRASLLYGESQLEKAVEFETLAQLLERELPGIGVSRRQLMINVASAGRLLTALKESDQLVNPGTEKGKGLIAEFIVADRKPVADSESLTVADFPMSVGRLLITKALNETAPPAAVLISTESQMAQAIAIVKAATVGQDLAWDSENGTELDHISHDTALSMQMRVLPGNLSLERHDHWEVALIQDLQERWLNTPKACLSGKSPLQAAEDPSLKIPLLAAAGIAQNFAFWGGYRWPLAEKLKLAKLPPLAVTEDLEKRFLSNWDIRRIDYAALSDDQISKMFDALIINSRPNVEGLIRNIIGRPSFQGTQVVAELRRQLLLLLLRDGRRDEAFAEVAQARAVAAEAHDAAGQVNWIVEELQMRLTKPKDEKIPGLMLEIWTHYGHKYKGLREMLAQVAARLQIPPPWEAVQVSSGGIVLPGAAAPTGQSLWLPS